MKTLKEIQEHVACTPYSQEAFKQIFDYVMKHYSDVSFNLELNNKQKTFYDFWKWAEGDESEEKKEKEEKGDLPKPEDFFNKDVKRMIKEIFTLPFPCGIECNSEGKLYKYQGAKRKDLLSIEKDFKEQIAKFEEEVNKNDCDELWKVISSNMADLSKEMLKEVQNKLNETID